MTEQEMVKKVDADLSPHTDFSSPYWLGSDSNVLESCFDKGFLRWNGNGKLVVTPLGRRSCGGTHSERHH